MILLAEATQDGIVVQRAIQPVGQSRFHEDIDKLIRTGPHGEELSPERGQAKMLEAFGQRLPIDPVGNLAGPLAQLVQTLFQCVHGQRTQRFAAHLRCGRDHGARSLLASR